MHILKQDVGYLPCGVWPRFDLHGCIASHRYVAIGNVRNYTVAPRTVRNRPNGGAVAVLEQHLNKSYNHNSRRKVQSRKAVVEHLSCVSH